MTTFYVIETQHQGIRQVYAVSRDELVSELTEIILRAEYDGLGPLVVFLGRWDGEGKLTPLITNLVREVPELDDYLDRYYELRDTNLMCELEFLVRINGRNLDGEDVLHD